MKKQKSTSASSANLRKNNLKGGSDNEGNDDQNSGFLINSNKNTDYNQI